jgi:hypothetical protein
MVNAGKRSDNTFFRLGFFVKITKGSGREISTSRLGLAKVRAFAGSPRPWSLP